MIAVVLILLIIGVFFALVGTLGVLRMPDVYGRLQASTCIATLSTICICLAGIVYAISAGMSAGTFVKLILFAVLVLCTNPASNHALMKAALKTKIAPAKPFVMNDYDEDFAGQAEAPVGETEADLEQAAKAAIAAKAAAEDAALKAQAAADALAAMTAAPAADPEAKEDVQK